MDSFEFTLAGWNVFMPRVSAFDFTGVGAILRDLPFSLSGCVTTKITSSLLTSPSNIGTAKPELPKNTIFILKLHADFCAELLDNLFALQKSYLVYKHYSVQMVCFMLYYPGKKAICVDF